MNDNSPYNVLFLCTGNSARSILAEVLINSMAGERFRGFSAGSHPTGYVHPMALAYLEKLGYETAGLKSKGWDLFSAPDAPELDFVFTVCDRAAAEPCPVWPGQPVSAHWGIEDPAALDPGESASEQARIKPFKAAFTALQRRIQLFMNLPIASLDRMKLKQDLDQIGRDADRE